MKLKRSQFKIITFVVAFAAISTTIGLTQVLAATGSMYLRASSNTLKKGASVRVSVRINPGKTVDSVQGTVTYDASKLQYVSASSSGTAFSTELGSSRSSGSVAFARGDFGSGVRSDALIQTITFKALVGSGSTSIGISGGNAANADGFTNPAVRGTSVSFYSPQPAPSAPAAPTSPSRPSTPERETEPSRSGGASNDDRSSAPSSSNSPRPSSGSSSSGSAPSRSNTIAPESSSVVRNIKQRTSLTRAIVTLSTPEPTTAFLRYGLGDDLSQQTSATKRATSHRLSLDPKLLVPGETYTYVVVTRDASGKELSTKKRTIQVKGLNVAITITDKDGELLRNTDVTLFSTPQRVTSDENGIATFTNVTPGDHRLVYKADKEYSQPVTVVNNVEIVDGAATAATQNFSVSYQTKPFSFAALIPVITVLLLLVAGITLLLFVRRNGLEALPVIGSRFSRTKAITPVQPPGQPTTAVSTPSQSPDLYAHDTVQSQWMRQSERNDNENR